MIVVWIFRWLGLILVLGTCSICINCVLDLLASGCTASATWIEASVLSSTCYPATQGSTTGISKSGRSHPDP